MRVSGTWGDNVEMISMSELYRRTVEVYAGQTTPRRTFMESVNYDNQLPPIRLAFKNGNHSNSIAAEDHELTTINPHQAGEFENAVLLSLSM